MLSKRQIIALLCVLLVLVLTTGCRKNLPVETYGNPIPQSEKITADVIKKAIGEAGFKRGWIMKPVSDNEIEASLHVRKHICVVMIAFTDKNYTIAYKSSTNLNYKNGKIHPQYRNWVLKLQKEINSALAEKSF